MLLKDNTYLYENLNSNDASKAFRSAFMISLLAETHVLAIKGYLDIPCLKSSELHHDGVAGIMGLCGAVVSFFHVLLLTSALS